MVNRLRERQGLRVELRQSPNGGVTAGVLIPEALIRDDMPFGEQALGDHVGRAPVATAVTAVIPRQRR